MYFVGTLLPNNPATSSPPTSTPNVALTSKAGQATAKAILTERACYQDTIDGLPPEYSRCYDQLSEEEKDDLSYAWELQEEGQSPCLIKGNISESGEKIYHLPGQEFYDATIIDTSRGERWFCTEDEARSAGWRKSLK